MVGVLVGVALLLGQHVAGLTYQLAVSSHGGSEAEGDKSLPTTPSSISVRSDTEGEQRIPIQRDFRIAVPLPGVGEDSQNLLPGFSPASSESDWSPSRGSPRHVLLEEHVRQSQNENPAEAAAAGVVAPAKQRAGYMRCCRGKVHWPMYEKGFSFPYGRKIVQGSQQWRLSVRGGSQHEWKDCNLV